METRIVPFDLMTGHDRLPNRQVGNLSLDEETRAGSYFVSNYPPYSFWGPDDVGQAMAMLDRPPAAETRLGIYLHIPFCRKRCHFCYFKVYTDKNAAEVENYVDALAREITLYSMKAVARERRPKFIYFGGGTPSYISSRQLTRLVGVIKRLFPWNEVEEVAFECEPGTLTEGKLQTIRELGVTRLSLGIENFNDEILEANGRAHSSKEIDRAYGLARSIGFPQINIDLIAGMVGETDDNWQQCVRRATELAADSVTIYQMEVPYNTTIFKEMQRSGQSSAPIAGWKRKREWVRYAFAALEDAGYTVGSAYTAVKDPDRTRFLYRDLLWAGADMIGLGVASFSHVQGVHFQNERDFASYCAGIARGVLPLCRAYASIGEERMIREFILQMKLGCVSRQTFQEKFGIDIQKRFADELSRLEHDGLAIVNSETVRLSRDGLLQVDRLLHQFFLPEHQNDPACGATLS
jgi:oxygen-independent coproporphyrinogen-3 oxidase